MKIGMNLHIIYQQDDDGGWLAEVPELHVQTKGVNKDLARKEVIAAAQFTLEYMREERKMPSTIEIESLSL